MIASNANYVTLGQVIPSPFYNLGLFRPVQISHMEKTHNIA